MAVIIITHDLGVVAGMADRINVMYGGKIVESGPTEQIFENPRMPYTIGLLRSVPRVDDERSARLTAIRGVPPDLGREIAGCHFAPRCDYAQPVCDTCPPPLRPVAPGQLAACLFDVDASLPLSAVAGPVHAAPAG